MSAAMHVFSGLAQVRRYNYNQVSSRARCHGNARGQVWGLHTVTCLFN